MATRGQPIAFVLSSLFVVALAAGGYWLLQKTKPEVCPICDRSIHAQARAVVRFNGWQAPVCCIRCGLTHNHLIGKPGQVVEVTEFHSLKPLRPESAFYVEGPRFSLCDPHDSLLIDQAKRPYARVFDRCEPSTYAFIRREDAEVFARENGGVVLRWADLTKEVETKP
jgi:hypothetical protein